MTALTVGAEAPPEWPRIALRWLVDFQNGADYKDVEDPDGPYEVIGSGGPFARSTAFLYDGESVLFGRKGTIDRPRHQFGRFWTVDTMYYTRLGSRVFGRFLYYWATTIPFGMLSTNTALPSMTQSDLGDLRVPLPTLAKQREIADFLDRETAKIDALISKQGQLVMTLLEHRDAEVLNLVTRGLDPGALRPSGVDWIGQVPSHWAVVRLRDSLASNESGTWGTDPLEDGSDTPCVRVADFDREAMRVCDPIPTNRQIPAGDLASRGLRRGDLLIERSGGTAINPVGCVVYYQSDTQAVSSNFISRMRMTAENHSRYWLYSLYAARLTRITQKWIKQTTGIQNLDFGGFSTEPFPKPPFDEQVAIADAVEELLGGIDDELARVRELTELLKERRGALITAAVTGQIDVESYGKGS